MITTPGHTRGCVCYQFGSFLFSGDTLFKGSIGRTDLDGGELEMALSVMDSSKAIVDSIQKKLFSLPLRDDRAVRPWSHYHFSR